MSLWVWMGVHTHLSTCFHWSHIDQTATPYHMAAPNYSHYKWEGMSGEGWEKEREEESWVRVCGCGGLRECICSKHNIHTCTGAHTWTRLVKFRWDLPAQELWSYNLGLWRVREWTSGTCVFVCMCSIYGVKSVLVVCVLCGCVWKIGVIRRQKLHIHRVAFLTRLTVVSYLAIAHRFSMLCLVCLTVREWEWKRKRVTIEK